MGCTGRRLQHWTSVRLTANGVREVAARIGGGLRCERFRARRRDLHPPSMDRMFCHSHLQKMAAMRATVRRSCLGISVGLLAVLLLTGWGPSEEGVADRRRAVGFDVRVNEGPKGAGVEWEGTAAEERNSLVAWQRATYPVAFRPAHPVPLAEDLDERVAVLVGSVGVEVAPKRYPWGRSRRWPHRTTSSGRRPSRTGASSPCTRSYAPWCFARAKPVGLGTPQPPARGCSSR